VSNERERKSVGEQETFEVDTRDTAFVLERARALAHTVWSRLEGHGFRAFRTVTVTVRFENFITFARSRTGLEAWASEEALSRRPSSCSFPSSTTARTPGTASSASSASARRSSPAELATDNGLTTNPGQANVRRTIQEGRRSVVLVEGV
jgi:nucleotidyltransferase/DNA polymerase involved in DNA repair